MARYILAILLFISPIAARASELPMVPTAQHVFRTADWTISAALVSTHVGDYLSTEQALRVPARAHEAVLPESLVRSHVGLAAYEAGTASLEILAYREMLKRHHRRLAMLAQSVNIGLTARTVDHNYELNWLTPHLRPAAATAR